jgi:hypothetical protein
LPKGGDAPEPVTSSRRLTQVFAATEDFFQSIVFPDTTLPQKTHCDNKFSRHASTLKPQIQGDMKKAGNLYRYCKSVLSPEHLVKSKNHATNSSRP